MDNPCHGGEFRSEELGERKR